MAEATFNELVGGEEIAAEILRDEDEADYDPADEVTHDKLQEGEIAFVGEAGDADDW